MQEFNSESSKLLVSVCVMTYQHKRYIRQCLESIIEQKTDFRFEVIVGEDGSTDGTREICRDYAKRYPDKIKLKLWDRSDVIENNNRPTGRANFMKCLSLSRGKYIAICEGDDYWSDPTKLQKQVDILENHPKCSICCHQVEVMLPDGSLKDSVKKPLTTISNIEHLAGGNFISTCSVVFRNYFNQVELPLNFSQVAYGDFYLFLFIAQFGKIFFINKKMAIYRYHGQGVYSSINRMNKRLCTIEDIKLLLHHFNNEKIQNRFADQVSHILLRTMFDFSYNNFLIVVNAIKRFDDSFKRKIYRAVVRSPIVLLFKDRIRIWQFIKGFG